MATRKSPARGTASRPAKATSAIGKTRRTAKKALKTSAKPAAPTVESNVVSLTAPAAAPLQADNKPAASAHAEEIVAAEEKIVETAVLAEEPVPTAPEAPEDYPLEPLASLTKPTPEPDATVDDEPVEDMIVEEAEVEVTFKPNAFSGASLFPGIPQFPSFPELPNFGAVDMNAFVASGTAVVEGMQNIGRELMDFSRQTAERNVETTMAVLGASSVQEAIDVQSRHAAGSLKDLVAEGTKLSGMAMDVASKATSSFTRG